MTNQNRISLTPYFDILHRYRYGAMLTLIVGTVCTFVILFMLPRKYVSTALLIFSPARVTTSPNTAPPMGEEIDARMDMLSLQVMSPENLVQLAREFKLYHGTDVSNDSLQDIATALRKHITLAPLKPDTSAPVDTRIYSLSFEYNNPRTALAVTSRLAQMFVDMDQTERSHKASVSAVFLGQQLKSMEVRLDTSADAIKQFETAHRGSVADNLSANMAAMENLHGELDQAQTSLAGLETRRMDIQRRMVEVRNQPITLSSASGQEAFSSPQEALSSLRTRLTMLRAQYSDQYPDVVELKDEIAALKSQIAQGTLPEQAPSPIAAELQSQDAMLAGQEGAIKGNVVSLQAQVSAARERVASTPANQQQLEALKRDYDVLSKSYHDLLEQKVDAEVSRNLQATHEGEQLQVLQPAKLPLHPSFPNRLTFASSGLIVSVMLALAIPFLFYFTDASYNDPEELQRECTVKVLATIPDLNRVPSPRRRKSADSAMRSAIILLLVIQAAAALIRAGVVA